jgi:hypothetical protein
MSETIFNVFLPFKDEQCDHALYVAHEFAGDDEAFPNGATICARAIARSHKRQVFRCSCRDRDILGSPSWAP